MIKTILLAEDDKGTAHFVRTSLQKQGYYVLWAANGLEALEIVTKNPVDLIVTDVVMPHMDGVDLYEELKKRKETENIPIIIITDKQIFMESFAALGVDHFVPKSSDINALIDKINHISLELKNKNYPKILINGHNRRVMDQMQKLLVSKRCLVALADNSLDTVHKAFMMSPHLIFLDLSLNDQAQTKEIVQSLRCFNFFHKMQILTYAYLAADQMDHAMTHWQIIEADAARCIEVGAEKFIGNFSQATFLDVIKEYLPEA